MLQGHHRLAEVLLGEELSREEKVDLLLRLRGRDDLLKESEALKRICGVLPPHKREELARQLGCEPDGRSLTKTQEKSLLAFFGVETERRGTALQKPSGVRKINPVYGLFEHQRDALARTQELLRGHDRRAVLHMPTGAGKTRTAMHLVAQHLREHEPTIVVWLAHSPELLEQAAEDFEVAWRSLGNREVALWRYWGSNGDPHFSEVDGLLVAGLAKLRVLSQESIDPFLLLADKTSLVVMDEAHQAVAPTYREVLEGLATKRMGTQLLGLTATPGRTWADIEADRALARLFRGNKVALAIEGYENPVDYLMEEGYLARPDFRTLNVRAGIDLSEEDRKRLRESLEIPDDLLRRLGDSDQFNLAVLRAIDELLSRHSRLIVFGVDVRHAKLLVATLSTRGYEAYCVLGETPTAERMHAIKRFRSNVGHPIVLVNYGVLTAGFDAPSASAALVARPTKSLVLFSQMVGRVTRGPKAGGNRTCEIVTVVDPSLPGFGSVGEAFFNWEDVWG